MFAAVFNNYVAVSGRRFHRDLEEARQKGYIEKTPHYKTVFKYLEMPGMTSVLKRLIIEASLPLRSVEVKFAVDSSGFSTSRFVRWCDHKYGQPREQDDWIKVSLMCGVETNVVTAVEIDEKKCADCIQFATLVKGTGTNFTMNEVSADAAYSTYDNHNLVAQYGATPFVAFKSNAKPKERGVYEKMFHFYNLKRDEFLSHYHKRSNVETTFSRIKA